MKKMEQNNSHEHKKGISYSIKKSIFWIGAPIVVIALAYLLGRSPPRNVEIVYQQQTVNSPLVKLWGYDKEYFSNVTIEEKGKPSAVFYPVTAVKKWDNLNYTERSRQSEEIYAYTTLNDLTLNLNTEEEPVKILIGAKDYSTKVRKTPKRYETEIKITEGFLANRGDEKDQNVMEKENNRNKDKNKLIISKSPGLEIIIYYKSRESANVDETQTKHLEDAERYLIKFVSTQDVNQ